MISSALGHARKHEARVNPRKNGAGGGAGRIRKRNSSQFDD